MGFSLILPILVTLSGIILLFRTRFFFVLHPLRTFKELFLAIKDRDNRRSFFLALAGTLGVGNIFGVSAGLIIGGEGALFWLLFSSLFSAVIKYAEVFLVFNGGSNKGTSDLISDGFPKGGRILAGCYVILTLFLSLLMGGAMQAASIADIMYESVGINKFSISIFLIIVLIPAFKGGTDKIEKITEKLIPMTTIIYIILCFCVIISNYSRIPKIIDQIFSSAFSIDSVIGGGLAVTVKEGFARGILSNEAGVGTSSLAHLRGQRRDPHTAGLFGIFEVAFDSVLLCGLTGITILLGVGEISAFTSPMGLVFSAFTGTLGSGSLILIPIIFSFAYATIICWYFYGSEYMNYCTGVSNKGYSVIFLLSVLVSPFLPSQALLFLIDVILLLMAVLTLSTIIKRFPRR